MKTKLVRPVLVETNEKNSLLWSYKGRRLYYDQANFNDLDETIYYQLILISLEDDKIENGDVCYDELNNTVNVYKPYPGRQNYSVKKVIATQDQISPEYIAKFVEQYNNGEVEDLEIEIITMNEGYTDANDYPYQETDISKLTNGFVTIVNKEPILYTEEEVYKLLKLGIGQAVSYPEQFVTGICFDNTLFNNWFTQNKKKQ